MSLKNYFKTYLGYILTGIFCLISVFLIIENNKINKIIQNLQSDLGEHKYDVEINFVDEESAFSKTLIIAKTAKILSLGNLLDSISKEEINIVLEQSTGFGRYISKINELGDNKHYWSVLSKTNESCKLFSNEIKEYIDNYCDKGIDYIIIEKGDIFSLRYTAI